MTVQVSPPPRWPIELRNTRALHGMVTELIGKSHDPQKPGFALIPSNVSPCGWGIYISDSETASAVANRSTHGVLYDRDVAINLGPLHRIKTPRVTKRGRRTLRIDCLTPVCIRSHHGDGTEVTRLLVTSDNMCSTMGAWLPRRLGIDVLPDAVQLVIKERATHTELVQMGGKYGVSKGFVGHLIVETNATGEWLLRCAETLGLGGKTAFGFGRIRVGMVE